ncbi:MAG: glycogen debranching N-terminal domain-containing protein, partial [Dehalococcoidia bacterium]
LKRRRRGRRLPPRVHPGGVTFSYTGRDGVSRRTSIHFAPHPNAIDAGQALFHMEVAPSQSVDIQAAVSLDQIVGRGTARRSTQSLADRYQQWKEGSTQVITSNELFNTVLDRSLTDLRVLWTKNEDTPYIAAGTPWFDTLFGRDTSLTALQTLAIQPEISRQALRSLAAHQGSQPDPEREEEPGKIHHELRRGEMANCGEVPYARYYGSVDSTPLFLLLANEYYRWTADLELMLALEPALRGAIQWIDRYGDLDGDGYLEYKRNSKRGLDNQGWKDSFDSMTHADGTLLKPPIAVVEVQGYVYAAKKGLARVFSDLGDHSQAEQLWADAERLRRRLNRDFWLKDGYYATALDARKSPATPMSSNAGQMLWTGVPSRHQARSLAERLMRNEMFSGWGIRTLISNARRYNPLGYHLGTVWPHDNAIIAAGLKRYGFESELNEIATGLFDACCAFPYFRLPELFGGDPRSGYRSPVPYPVACRPLAMAAAAMPYILTSILGLCPDAPRRRLQVVRPRLPYWLEFVRLTGLRVGEGQVDLVFQRRGKRTFVNVLASRGPVEVVVLRRWPQDRAWTRAGAAR